MSSTANVGLSEFRSRTVELMKSQMFESDVGIEPHIIEKYSDSLKVWSPTTGRLSAQLCMTKSRRLVRNIAKESERVIERMMKAHEKANSKRKWLKQSRKDTRKAMAVFGGGWEINCSKKSYDRVTLIDFQPTDNDDDRRCSLTLVNLHFDCTGVQVTGLLSYTYHAIARLIGRWGGEIDYDTLNLLAVYIDLQLDAYTDGDRDARLVDCFDVYVPGVGSFIVEDSVILTFIGEDMLDEEQLVPVRVGKIKTTNDGGCRDDATHCDAKIAST
ncbi:hypothetical protein [uncultured Umboniibacter sp.]|uniref:hypothetical protein n=1 Tax=uncultured Umboniibacter sp. TaxID=1798917 RepID=UPI002631EEA9|nr:hypothetical protein [uncultured Umboniibacter sp.]